MFVTLSRRLAWLVAIACLVLAFIIAVPYVQVAPQAQANVNGLRAVATSHSVKLTARPAEGTATAVAAKTQVAKEPKGRIRTRDYGSWSYEASREESGLVVATVRYDTKTAEGVRAYAAANKQLATELATSRNEAIVKVTFKKPFPVDAYRAWAASSGVTQFDYVYTRVKNSAGRDGMFSVVAHSQDPLPQSGLDSFMLSSKQMDNGPYTVVGVIYFEGRIAADRLVELSSDPDVFVADVTHNIIVSELVQDGIYLADRTHVSPVDVFVVLESLGLHNFK